AIAALRNTQFAPGLLNRLVSVRVEAFDRGDLAPDHMGTRLDTEAHGALVDDNGTSAAEGLPAAKFGACRTNYIAEKPEQRKVGIAIPVPFLAINIQLDHDRFSLFLSY